MRKFFLLTLLSAAAITSCKKNDKKIDPEVSAKAGKAIFYSSGKMVTSHKDAMGSYNSATIEGLMSDGATLRLWIRSYSEELDTFAMDSTGASATYLPPTPSVEVKAVRGTLIILSTTPVYSGSYNFVCSDSTVVTGTFKINPL